MGELGITPEPLAAAADIQQNPISLNLALQSPEAFPSFEANISVRFNMEQQLSGVGSPIPDHGIFAVIAVHD
jgi:hypothetical protein